MFPVEHALCIFTNKFAHSFFFLPMCVLCIHKSVKCRKTCQKIICRPEHAENTSSVYLLNQIFESVSDLFVKEISKRIWSPPIWLFVCVYLPVLLIKSLRIAVFLLIKLKIKFKKRIPHSSFWMYYWKHTCYVFWLYTSYWHHV